MIYFKFLHRQFPVRVHFCISQNLEDVLPFLNKKGKKKVTLEDIGGTDTEFLKSTAAHVIQYKQGNFLLWTRKPIVKPEDHGTLSHEAFHVVSQIREYIGAPTLTKETEEDWAYLIDWVIANIHKGLKKHESKVP